METKTKSLKVAIVHDWLYGGGAEKVVLELHKMFPEAPIYTSFSTKEWEEKLDNKVITGYLNKWPFNKLRKFIPMLRIWWFEHLDLTRYDLVISSSGAEAKGVKKLKKGSIHVNYCHAPTHYYWSKYNQFIKEPGFGVFNVLARAGLRLLVKPLRSWDYKAAQRPNYIITNSTYIQEQVEKYYSRKSVVIHPPVDIERFINTKSTMHKKGLIITGRQVPYKRIDLAIKAAMKLNQTLVVIGKGPMHQELIKLANGNKNIKFLNNASDKIVKEELAKAQLFIFPCLEDFGIAPVEALASGTPVVAFKKGGALDYINDQNGIFFNQQNLESLSSAIEKALKTSWNNETIKKSSKKFSKENFQKNMTNYLEKIKAPQ
ncbi:glycosyltransferase [Candidatus Nomurabacteria bacterium]|nr:glycosyltransferase [Candidatus Nomurabacteria bacterium]